MTPLAIFSIIEAGIRLGFSAIDIVERLCTEQGGQILPTLQEFEAHIEKLRALPDLKDLNNLTAEQIEAELLKQG